LFKENTKNEVLLILICQIIRSLLLDDDLRVEISRSHEHAKYIVSQLNGIDTLLSIGLSNDTLNEDTLGNIMLKLSKLAVRNEYCQEICDKGGLKFVIKCISEEHLSNLILLKSALSLLKSICNNDVVKQEATKSNGFNLLCEILSKYVANSTIYELRCACLPTFLLRNQTACEQLVSLNGDLTLLQILNVHLAKSTVTVSEIELLTNYTYT
jgi:armadillo repeat-containing protein 6